MAFGWVEDEINKIIEPKIGVHVDFETLVRLSMLQNLGLMMSGGEQVDVVSFLGTFSQMIAKNQLMDITEYMDTVASETKEVVGEDFLKATSVDGRVYAIPTLNGKAAVPNIVIRSDLVELGLDLGELKQATNWDKYLKIWMCSPAGLKRFMRRIRKWYVWCREQETACGQVSHLSTI